MKKYSKIVIVLLLFFWGCFDTKEYMPCTTKIIVDDTLNDALRVIAYTKAEYNSKKERVAQAICVSRHSSDTLRILNIELDTFSEKDEIIRLHYRPLPEKDTIWIAFDKNTKMFNRKKYPIYYGSIGSLYD